MSAAIRGFVYNPRVCAAETVFDSKDRLVVETLSPMSRIGFLRTLALYSPSDKKGIFNLQGMLIASDAVPIDDKGNFTDGFQYVMGSSTSLRPLETMMDLWKQVRQSPPEEVLGNSHMYGTIMMLTGKNLFDQWERENDVIYNQIFIDQDRRFPRIFDRAPEGRFYHQKVKFFADRPLRR